MECPDCEQPLGRNAKYCGCGWKKDAPKGNGKLAYPDEPPRVPCCHEGCFVSAKVKIKTPLGWANLCDMHYPEYFRKEADKTCERMGLDTPAKQRRFVMDCALAHKLPIREPGEEEAESPF